MDLFDIEIKLKSYLNQRKIRLCDDPYTTNNEKGYGLKTLAEDISKEMNREIFEIEEILEELRKKAILNIASIAKFKEKNVCSIKIYQPKHSIDTIVEIDDINIETGSKLRIKICQIFNANVNLMRMIFRGKLINDNDVLSDIGIKNNSKVMILNLSESDCTMEDISSYLDQGRQMAEYLSKRAIDGKFQSDFLDLEITNQSGEVLQLTNEQKSHITYGLTMHKQATNYILQGRYQIALLHCLEAEEAFTRSKYCDQVDNVALLQLDIVWCYFCLQNVDDITESKRRLEVCEQRMAKCYGEDNERIQRIREKRTFEGVPEGVHIFRLYLMKAILAYYENDNDSAVSYLTKALDLYNSLSVPDNLIVEVMQLGFTREQAIDGLRVNKNVNIAVEYIFRRIEDLKVLEAQNEETTRTNSIVRRLGLTADNSRIDLAVLRRLIEQSHMAPSLCLAAIRRANNNYADGLDLVFNQEQDLERDVQLAQHSGEVHDGDISYDAVVTEKTAIKHIKELVSHDKATIKRCLRQSDGNIDRTIDMLLDHNSNISPSSVSHCSSESSMDKDEESQRAEMEETIYENIGEGSGKSLQSHYANPDLFNEITAFNKFAHLLNVSGISSMHEDIQWN